MRDNGLKFIHIINIMIVSYNKNMKNPNKSLQCPTTNLQIALSIMHSIACQH